jgi:predicted dehydrogenase
MPHQPQPTRREFIAGSALVAAGLSTLPEAKASTRNAAADKVVLALIGVGGRGTMLTQGFMKQPNVEFAYLCDPDDTRGAALSSEIAKAQGQAPKRVRDMRRIFDDKDVDAVIIATPEHWHALASVWACQAGKDVYVEKNASLTVWEGRKMIEAARKYDRIVQVGTQNRSGPYNMAARDYIKSGKLGKIQLVKVFNLQGGAKWTPQPDTTPPPTLDWDLWLGPAPQRPYSVSRQTGWGDYFDYAGGTLAGDGSHQLDLARMVLGDPPCPKAVHCVAGRWTHDDKREIPDMMEITYEFPDMVMTMENGTSTPYMDKIAWDVRDGDLFPYWPQCATRIEIYGTEGLMYLGRHGGGWQVFGKPKVQSRPSEVVAQAYGRFPDPWHQANFLECVRTRKRPNADIEEAHRSACLVTLANSIYRAGHTRAKFDADTEMFVDREANRFLKPAYRKAYVVPDQV